MINYYYEIYKDTTVFGQDIRYLSITDLKPDTIGWRHLHEEALTHSRRVWLENANGISLIKGPVNELGWDCVGEQELVWLKLICKDIESI